MAPSIAFPNAATLAAGVAFVLIAAAAPSSAHGILIKPASRNWKAYLDWNYYWPDGNNAGGYQVVGNNGNTKWPYGQHGLCGDAANDGKAQFMQAGPVQETYKEGQEVDIHVLVHTNHYGRFHFRVCPMSATKDSDCIQLKRSDGKADSWDLPKVAQGNRFNGGAMGDALRPAEVTPTFTWYPQPHVDCPHYKYCTRFEGTPVYVVKFKLPPGYKCDRCILQWHYVTGHKCHPPCIKSDPYYPDCRNKAQFHGTYLATMDYCGSPYAAYPEEFWNCADIKIA